MLIKMELLNNVKSFLAQVLYRRSNKAVAIINQIIEANDTTTSLINLKLDKFNIASRTS
ncbi:MAG: hypothetical protein JWP67_2450 [Mucilaginibacter sp.]|jgi:hypothetical protein|nr:hypothetical protein [Mucilaginibacter sp.]